MGINPASAAAPGQLRWVNLKAASASQQTVTDTGSGSATFEKLLSGQVSVMEPKVAVFGASAPVVRPDQELLWHVLSPGGAERISGEISSSGSVPSDYEELILNASAAYGVPADLIKAVIDTESSFNPDAVSSAGAKGLMQLMDGTASGLGVDDSFDPAQNIDGGVKYLSYQLERFGGEVKMALAAYNAGPNRVAKLGVNSDAALLEQLEQLPQETQAYIFKVERARDKYNG